MKKFLSIFFGVLFAIVFAVVNAFAASQLITDYSVEEVMLSVFFPLAIAFCVLWWFKSSKRVTLMLTTAFSLPLTGAAGLGFLNTSNELYSVLLWVGSLLTLAVISDILISRIRRKSSSGKVNSTPTTS